MQYLVLFLAIIVLGVALVVGFRPRPASQARIDGTSPLLGLQEPDPVLPPVLLPEQPTGADVDALRLSPALRGYRCDQVDGVLDALGSELDRLRARVQELEAGAPVPSEVALSEAEEDAAEAAATLAPEDIEQAEEAHSVGVTNAAQGASEDANQNFRAQ